MSCTSSISFPAGTLLERLRGDIILLLGLTFCSTSSHISKAKTLLRLYFPHKQQDAIVRSGEEDWIGDWLKDVGIISDVEHNMHSQSIEVLEHSHSIQSTGVMDKLGLNLWRAPVRHSIGQSKIGLRDRESSSPNLPLALSYPLSALLLSFSFADKGVSIYTYQLER
jgi:hypothetical protein